MNHIYDFAVIGAGVFGAWTAACLRESGKVILLDAYGPANSRASSGGESRIIRMAYGPDDLYTRWSARSLQKWQSFFERLRKPLFHRTGVLWLVGEGDTYTHASLQMIQRAGLTAERLSRDELQKQFPQIAADDLSWALFEPNSGVLMARQSVQAVVEDLVLSGVAYLRDAVIAPDNTGHLDSVTTASGAVIHAGAFIFACGPWLPKLFPGLLAKRMFITRQEVFFFGAPSGTNAFAAPALPTWICIADQVYGMPELEQRGIKIAFDRHGPEFDPESGARVVSEEGLIAVREYVGRRFPRLKNAPVIETRVCQYENTSKGDFLIDRHPEIDNVWIAGGGSGHGFKHGPAVGEYVAELVLGRVSPEPRFSLATKHEVQRREIF